MTDLQLFDALPPHIEDALRASIRRFGVLVPIIRDQHGRVIDGHHRVRIAAEEGIAIADDIVITVADEDEAREIARTVNADRRQLTEEQRRAVAVELRQQGHSYRAIGGALGVSHEQIRKDIQKAATVNGLTVAQPERVKSLDGKERPATRPTPPPSPPEPEPGIWYGGPLADEQPEPEPEEKPISQPLEGLRPHSGLTDLYGDPAPRPKVQPWTEEEIDLRTRVANGETVVVSMREGRHARLIAWAEQRDLYVRIDRRSPWGNPFELGADGDRDTVIANYAEHYLPHKPSLLGRLSELRGKALGCWCAPDPCHGDVLKERAE